VTEFIEDRSVASRPAAPPDTTVHYGQLAEQVADVWYGKSAPQHKPLLIMIHGGFWRPPIDRTHTGPLCEALANMGWTIASIEYRRIPGKPDASAVDVCAAVAALPGLIERHNGKAIVIGHSAGGHLCLYAAARSDQPKLIGVVALGPAADLQMAESLNLGNGAAQAFLGVPAAQRVDLDPVRLPAPAAQVAIVHGMQDANRAGAQLC
jgi:acetyl esterase/lipase